MWKPAVIDAATGEVRIPHGSIGDRFGDEGVGRWNLELGDIDPALSMYRDHQGGTREAVEVELPRFDAADGKVVHERRGVPVARVGDRVVTTVLDLLLAQYGVARAGLPGTWPRAGESDVRGYDDPAVPATPAWQEQHTGVPAAQVVRLAREWAQNAIDTEGRGMILLGCRHQPLVPLRPDLSRDAAAHHDHRHAGPQRRRLGALRRAGEDPPDHGLPAHGVRPGLAPPAAAHEPDRLLVREHLASTATTPSTPTTSTPAPGSSPGKTVMDLLAQSVRLGLDRRRTRPSTAAACRWPTTPRRPARRRRRTSPQQLKAGAAAVRGRGPRGTRTTTRGCCRLWRSNLLGSSAKGNEYFLRHLLGTDSAATAVEAPPDKRPRDVVWAEKAAEGRLDLLMTIDFRMTSLDDPQRRRAAGRDLVREARPHTTDMHPFIHSFNPAIAPPWQTKSDWDAWKVIAKQFSELAVDHLGTRKDVVAKPLWHDTPEAMATVHGVVKDWKTGEVDPVPGKTMPVHRGRRARLHRGLREDDLDRPAPGEGRHAHQGRRVRRRRARSTSCASATAWSTAAPATASPRSRPTSRWPTRCSTWPASPTATWPRRASSFLEKRTGTRARRPRRRARGQADHLRRHPGGAGPGDHLAGVVRLGVGRAALQPVHHQHRAQEAVPHPHRAPAVLRRPRLVPRDGRDAARSTDRRST